MSVSKNKSSLVEMNCVSLSQTRDQISSSVAATGIPCVANPFKSFAYRGSAPSSRWGRTISACSPKPDCIKAPVRPSSKACFQRGDRHVGEFEGGVGVGCGEGEGHRFAEEGWVAPVIEKVPADWLALVRPVDGISSSAKNRGMAKRRRLTIF